MGRAYFPAFQTNGQKGSHLRGAAKIKMA